MLCVRIRSPKWVGQSKRILKNSHGHSICLTYIMKTKKLLDCFSKQQCAMATLLLRADFCFGQACATHIYMRTCSSIDMFFFCFFFIFLPHTDCRAIRTNLIVGQICAHRFSFFILIFYYLGGYPCNARV